jgi:DNA polymerase-3 subunit epsilon
MVDASELPLVFDRQSAIAWAQAVLSDPHALFLDTETTGLDGDSEIIEIAVVDRSGATLINSLVKPSGSIPAAATAIHNLCDLDVAAAPAWSELYPKIVSICRDRKVVVYNAVFDSRLIGQSCRRCGLSPLPSRFHCAMQAFTLYDGPPASRGRNPYRSLSYAAGSFMLTIPAHRALGDALACLGVVRGMAYRG